MRLIEDEIRELREEVERLKGRRCETCGLWAERGPDWEFGDITLGTCTAAKMRSTIKDEACDAAGIDREDRPWDEGEAAYREALKSVKAIAIDGSGYYAALQTTPDFGCVLWQSEPRPPAQGVEIDYSPATPKEVARTQELAREHGWPPAQAGGGRG